MLVAGRSLSLRQDCLIACGVGAQGGDHRGTIVAVFLVEGAVEPRHGGVELVDVHHLVAALEFALDGAVEGEGGDVDIDGLLAEAHGGEGAPLVVLAVGEFGIGVAIVEREAQETVVGRGLHVAALGHDDVHLAGALGVVVDDDIAQLVAVLVFLADTDDIALELLVVLAGADIDGGFLARDVVERHTVFQHGCGHDVVGEIEGHACEQQHDEGHGHHGAPDRDAAGLHGHKLVFLAEVAHGHDGGEEHGDGQRHGDEGGGSIEEQLSDDAELEALAHEVVDILPYELHEQHQHREGEGEQQRPDEGAEYETIDFFHLEVL